MVGDYIYIYILKYLDDHPSSGYVDFINISTENLECFKN